MPAGDCTALTNASACILSANDRVLLGNGQWDVPGAGCSAGNKTESLLPWCLCSVCNVLWGEAEGQHGVCGQIHHLPSGTRLMLRQSRAQGSAGNFPFAALALECPNSILSFVAVRKWCPEISSLKQTQGKRKRGRGDSNDRNDIFHTCKLKVKSVRWYNLDESKLKCGP